MARLPILRHSVAVALVSGALFALPWAWQSFQEPLELQRQPISVLGHDHILAPTNIEFPPTTIRATGTFAPTNFEAMVEAGLNAKVLQLITDRVDWVDGERVTEDILETLGVSSWFELFKQRALSFIADSEQPDAQVVIIREADDFFFARDKQKAGLILGSEGVGHLEGSVVNLTTFYDLGLRHLQLYRKNVDYPAVDQSGELTSFGVRVIEKCNELGIAVDVTHLDQLPNGDEVLSDVISILGDRPVILSHQNPMTLGGRLTDKEIIAVSDSGGNRGVIGIHFYGPYVASSNVSGVADIVDYLKELVGIDHVALGGDYFPEDTAEWAVPDLGALEELRQELSERGYDSGDVNQIMGGNLVAFYEAVWAE